MTFQDLLETYNAATLKAIAAFNNLEETGSKKEIIARLSSIFLDPTEIHKRYEGLSPAEHEVVQALLQNGGAARRSLFERFLASRGAIHTAEHSIYRGRPRYRMAGSRELPDILARLLALGLVFADLEKDPRYDSSALLDFQPANVYLIPPEIRRHLPEPPPVPPPPPLAGAQVVREVPGSARTFQRDIFLYWSYIHEHKVKLLASGLLSKRDLTGLSATLLVPEKIGKGVKESDFPRLVFLRALLTQLELLSTGWEGSLEAAPNPAFLALDPEQRISRAFEAYVQGRWVNELASHIGFDNDMEAVPLLPAPAGIVDARKLVLEFVKRAQGWVSLEALRERIKSEDYEFLFSRDYKSKSAPYYYQMPSHPYSSFGNRYRWNFFGIKNETQGWDYVEGFFINHVLLGPLFWMGLVDFGFSQEGLPAPDTFRLTSVGTWLLGKGPAPEIPKEGGQVIVQPNFQILAFDPVSDVVLMNLSRFAERVSAERVAEFHLTRSALYAGQQAGWDAPRVQQYLEDLTQQPLPENVARTLVEWQNLHERITIHRGVSLVHAAQPADLEALLADSEVRKLLGRRFTPILVEVCSTAAVDDLVKRLRMRDQLPLVRRQGQTPEPLRVVKLEEREHELYLRFTIPAPDLYLHGQLAPFAEQDGGPPVHGYRMTPRSVRQAARAGMEAPQILAALERVLTAPLTESTARRILAWSGHFGEATLEETFLLRLKDEKTLKELQADPEVGPLLQPFQPRDPKALAQVRPKDLARLEELLAARGVEIKER